MRKKMLSHQRFDTRSVLLFAALSFGGAAVMHAHAQDTAIGPATAPAPVTTVSPGKAAAKPTPPAAANPANQSPAMSQKNDVPSMVTSPAFGPRTKADKRTGSANNPDKRPVIEATRPTELAPAKEPAERK